MIVDNNDGRLRVAVAGGGDGAGTVTRTIVSSEEGTALYTNVVQVDGSVTASTTAQQVHAGDAETHLQFVYTPVETITNGELRFTVDSDWSNPQANSSSEPGYTTVSSSGGGIGSVEFNTASGYLTVPIHSLDKSSTITVDYGTGSGGAEAPDSAETSTFIFAIRGSDTELGGVLKSLTTKQPQIIVRPQASGRGSVSIDTGGDVHAGQEGRTVTITYSPEGQVVNGRLKVGVPADWSDALAANFNISPGTPKFGGPLDADQLAADDDLDSVDELVVSSINLRATQNLVLTFMTDIQPTAGTAPFTFAFDGGHGPDEGFLGLANQEVEVMEAAAGSGEAEPDQMGKIVVGDIVEEIVITYTAEGQIKGTIPGITDTNRLFEIKVPTADGWSAPSRTENAAGYYAVTHEAPDDTQDTGYGLVTGKVEAMAPGNENADDEEATYIVARVLPEQTVEKGERLIFSYQNGVAPDAPGKSEFVFLFDERQVDILNVLVESAGDASALDIVSEESFMIDDGGTLTVTVKLLDSEDNLATRSTDTTVNLRASSGTISSVTIPAGDYHAETTLSAEEAANITITATAATATGLADAEPLTVLADTNSPSIDADSITVEPMHAKEGMTVTISAMATKARTVNTVLFSIGTTDGSNKPVDGSPMTEDEPGKYIGKYKIANGAHNGTYNVTVEIIKGNGDETVLATETATGALTVDTVLPVITAPSRGDASHVKADDEVTISATLSEASTVSADVSMLNAAEPTLSLMDADGDGEGMIYTGSVTVTADGDVADMAIEITAEDAAGNTAEPASVMVTLDNTKPMITGESIDMPDVMTGGEATISATLSEGSTVSADVSMLNAAEPTLSLMDADGDGEGMIYTGSVIVTADGDVADIAIAITAADAAGNTAEPASVMVTLDNTDPVITDEDIDMSFVMMGAEVTISATLSEASTVTADVTALNAAAPTLLLEDADGEGMVYTGKVIVTAEGDAADIAIAITAADAAGNTAEPASVMVTLDNTDPVITGEAIDMPSVMMGGMATISATLSEGSTVSADVSMLNADDSTLPLEDADGEGEGLVYTGKVMITEEGDVEDIAIEITAADAAGNTDTASVTMVTLDNTDPVITGESIDMPSVMTGGEAIISATLSEASTVSADVSMLNADDSTLPLTDADGNGVYEGKVMVTAEGDVEDIAIAITAADAAGNTAEPASVMVTLDNTDPVITGEAIDMLSVMMGSMATISATLSEGSTVSADVSMLNADDSTLPLTDADGDGVYEGTVPVTAEGDAADIAIEITAADAAGNTAEPASVTVTLDNTKPEVTGESIDMSAVMAGDAVTISAMVSEASTVSADVSMLNAADSTLLLEDADGDGVYEGTVPVTAEGDAVDIAIAITAADAAGNTAEPASVMVTLDNTKPEVTGESIDMSAVMAGDAVTISAMVSEASTVSADVSMLNAADSTLLLEDADGTGMYSGSVMVTADGNADNVAIEITAEDAAGNMGMASVMVTLDNTMPEVTGESIDMSAVMMGDAVTISAMVSEASTVSADVSMLNAAAPTLSLTDADGTGMYSGSVMVTADGDAADIVIAITAADAAGNTGTASVMVTLDNTKPEVTAVSGSPSPARNGHEITISAMVSEAATVTADVSMLDTTQTEMVTLTDDDGDLTYTVSFTISEENEADNGSREVTVMATDAAGNSGTAAGSVDLINTLDYTSMIPQGISLFHVPLDVTAIDGSEASLSMVSDLYKALGDTVNYIISTEDGIIWNSYLGGTSGDAAITADRGLVVVMNDEKTIKFTGNAWGEDAGPGAGEGASMITLRSGLNLVGLPVNDASVLKVSAIMDLPEFAGKITSIIVSTDDGKFASVAAGGIGDDDVRGDASYLVFSSAVAAQPVTGEGWSNGEMAGAAPIALFGHKVDNQTPALFVEGSIVDDLTGLAREGFRIKVKNLSTKAALSTISQGDVAQGGYNMTFVDTKAGNAARIGDVLEISADSPDPLIGVKPVRHIVTIDDVKNSRIQLEDLIAYEIPAETELLRNYPNPFNPETWIPYRLAEDTDVSLTIYDVSGELVRSIDIGHQTAAVYESRAKAIYWDGRNRFGEQVASGIYFYSLSTGDFSATRKMVILK